jgi:Raf kinase inhibitor-like YbhB/YbcL family protein
VERSSSTPIRARYALLIAWLALSAAVAGRSTAETGGGAMKLSSTAFKAGSLIPRTYTGEGRDVSPPLAWSDPPEDTAAFALICDDPDAPRAEPWVHWVAYGIDRTVRALPEGAQDGFVSGRNDFGRSGYGGPMPPRGHGLHHYHFVLYALDKALELAPGLTKAELLRAIDGHVLEEAELVGTYERE